MRKKRGITKPRKPIVKTLSRYSKTTRTTWINMILKCSPPLAKTRRSRTSTRTLLMIWEKSKRSTTKDSKKEESATKLRQLCKRRRMSKMPRWKSCLGHASGSRLIGEAWWLEKTLLKPSERARRKRRRRSEIIFYWTSYSHLVIQFRDIFKFKFLFLQIIWII